MRTVTDILEGVYNPATKEVERAPVAYVLHRDHHEAVCPWCGGGLGRVVMPPGSTQGDLYATLLDRQVTHMPACPQSQAVEYGVTVQVTRRGRVH